jgi:hypothetical protein
VGGGGREGRLWKTVVENQARKNQKLSLLSRIRHVDLTYTEIINHSKGIVVTLHAVNGLWPLPLPFNTIRHSQYV